jgi:hypothetical protein
MPSDRDEPIVAAGGLCAPAGSIDPLGIDAPRRVLAAFLDAMSGHARLDDAAPVEPDEDDTPTTEQLQRPEAWREHARSQLARLQPRPFSPLVDEVVELIAQGYAEAFSAGVHRGEWNS